MVDPTDTLTDRDTTNTAASFALLAGSAYNAGHLALGHMLTAAANGEEWAIERCNAAAEVLMQKLEAGPEEIVLPGVRTMAVDIGDVMAELLKLDTTPPAGARRGFDLDGE